jgi:hypothetical protein
MIYLVFSALGLSLYGNFYLFRKDKVSTKQIEVLKAEVAVLEKMHDDLSKEYSDFVDFVDEEEIRIQDEVSIKLMKSLQDELLTEALRIIKPVYEA